MNLKPRSLSPLYLLLLLLTLCLAFHQAGLALNLTRSLPYGIYQRVTKPAITTGMLVTFCLPEDLARFARSRGFVYSGGCPGDALPLLKRVLATEGSVVEITEQGTFIDDWYRQHSAPPKDHRDRPLTRWPLGCFALTPHQLWLGADHPHSFDSRYYGPIDERTLRGVYRPLWTWSF